MAELAEAASQSARGKWSFYQRILATAQERAVPFAIGGGLATMVYTCRPRESKDIDLFVMAEHRQRMIQATLDCGLRDLFDEQPYDRSWIYRAHDGPMIVDVIWQMANHRAAVDGNWLQNGPQIEIEGLLLRLAPAEETLWSKLYILQHDRCDWPDALTMLSVVGPRLNWRRLLSLVGEDRPLLAALLCLFRWLCPQRAKELPRTIWHELQIENAPARGPIAIAGSRADLLDSRPWFTASTTESDACAVATEVASRSIKEC